MTIVHPHSKNIGILGPGRVAARLANAISLVEGLNFWSVCSRQLSNAKAFAYQHHAKATISAYDDFYAMLHDPELDAIIIATPDNHHFQYALDALKNNKHVFIEKPLCTSVEEGLQLIAQSKKTKSVVAIGYHLRWHPGLRTLSKKIQAVDFGNIHHLSMHWAHAFIEEASWRKARTTSRWWSLSTLGTHCLDIACWLMHPKCGEVKNIKCITTHKNYHANDETATILIEFESGSTASIYTSILFHTPFKIELFGDKHHVKGEKLVGSNDKGNLYINNLPIEYPVPSNLYACELKNFLHAIYGNENVEVSLEEGFKNIELLLTSCL